MILVCSARSLVGRGRLIVIIKNTETVSSTVPSPRDAAGHLTPRTIEGERKHGVRNGGIRTRNLDKNSGERSSGERVSRIGVAFLSTSIVSPRLDTRVGPRVVDFDYNVLLRNDGARRPNDSWSCSNISKLRTISVAYLRCTLQTGNSLIPVVVIVILRIIIRRRIIAIIMMINNGMFIYEVSSHLAHYIPV